MGDEREGWAVWFVGLPGSGKSCLAKGVYEKLSERGDDVVWLEMDKRRGDYLSKPSYSAEEREESYSRFVDEAATLVGQGKGVLMDGTAYKASMRQKARERISKFAEIFVSCPLNVAVRREAIRPDGAVMAGLYEKALDRKRTGKLYEGLGDVVGVDVPFEEDENAECVIENSLLSKEQTLERAMIFLDRWLKE